MTAARRPESWEEIWDAELDALTEAGAPPAEEDYGWLDPAVDPPAELAGADGAGASGPARRRPGPAGSAWPGR